MYNSVHSILIQFRQSVCDSKTLVQLIKKKKKTQFRLDCRELEISNRNLKTTDMGWIQVNCDIFPQSSQMKKVSQFTRIHLFHGKSDTWRTVEAPLLKSYRLQEHKITYKYITKHTFWLTILSVTSGSTNTL